MCLRGVWGQVDLFGGPTLVLWVYHHTVACEACEASQTVFLARHVPAHYERSRSDLGELEVSWGRDCWKEREEKEKRLVETWVFTFRRELKPFNRNFLPYL